MMTPKEVMLLVLPVVNLLIYLVLMMTIFGAMGSAFNKPDNWDEVQR